MTILPDDPRHRFGRRAENYAARELRRQGYKILARNWRTKIGEVDLIARDGDDLVIVEVKARQDDHFGGPELAVGPTKQRKLSKLLALYVQEHGLEDVNCRFDVVSVLLGKRGRFERVEIFRDAFEYLD